MEANDLNKYLLEQAKIEVEHARSWPTKILAFYVAINFGLVATLLGLAGRTSSPLIAPVCVKMLLTLALLTLFFWALVLFRKNHLSYLRHRNIQVQFQKQHLEEKYKDPLSLPQDWFIVNDVSITTRGAGWGFYAYNVLLVTLLTLAGIWAGA